LKQAATRLRHRFFTTLNGFARFPDNQNPARTGPTGECMPMASANNPSTHKQLKHGRSFRRTVNQAEGRALSVQQAPAPAEGLFEFANEPIPWRLPPIEHFESSPQVPEKEPLAPLKVTVQAKPDRAEW
jgi:hypothetical protein